MYVTGVPEVWPLERTGFKADRWYPDVRRCRRGTAALRSGATTTMHRNDRGTGCPLVCWRLTGARCIRAAVVAYRPRRRYRRACTANNKCYRNRSCPATRRRRRRLPVRPPPTRYWWTAAGSTLTTAAHTAAAGKTERPTATACARAPRARARTRARGTTASRCPASTCGPGTCTLLLSGDLAPNRGDFWRLRWEFSGGKNVWGGEITRQNYEIVDFVFRCWVTCRIIHRYK